MTKDSEQHRPFNLSRRHLYLIGGTVFVALVLFIGMGIWFTHSPQTPTDDAIIGDSTTGDTDDNSGGDASSTTPPSGSSSVASPSFIDLQPTVDTWLASTNRQVGLMIYDLDNDRVAASYQPNKTFNIASIYKLFYVYDGYRQLASGAEQGTTKFTTTSDYRADTYTISECLDLMIRESYNGCADPMRSNSARSKRVQTMIDDELQLEDTFNLGLSSTAADLTKLLRLYYEHADLPDELWDRIADSMLNQPPTEVETGVFYDWRQGLPAGFSTAKIYDKVGWESDNRETWNIYADAAIVEFPNQNRHYSIVVLTTNFTDAKLIANLGTTLETAILSAKE